MDLHVLLSSSGEVVRVVAGMVVHLLWAYMK